MAKETAHQIGTPLSSMIGWITLMKEEAKDLGPLLEMEKDVDRLKMITERFSKVGSLPKLDSVALIDTANKTIQYLDKRTSDLVMFKVDFPKEEIYIPLNPQLFSWTLENLIKNGIDAMKGKGEITLKILETENETALEISDTGSGIKQKFYKNIFTPGFTSKKRGWGLGLSLAKRIIKDYHKGKISVKNSEIGKGTTFEIILKK